MKPPDAPNPAGWRPCHWRSRLIGCALVLVGWLPAGGVWADGGEALGWARFTEENNNLGSNNDRYYVNGFEAGYLSQPLSASGNWSLTHRHAHWRMPWAGLSAARVFFATSVSTGRCWVSRCTRPRTRTARCPIRTTDPTLAGCSRGWRCSRIATPVNLDDLSRRRWESSGRILSPIRPRTDSTRSSDMAARMAGTISCTMSRR